MANKELTALPAVGTLSSTQVLYLVDENNNSRKVALSDLAQWIKTAASIVPASNPWKGARVYRTADFSVSTSTLIFVAWQSVDLDTNTFWSAGAPTRFTVPNGVTKVRVSGSARFSANSLGVRQIFAYKNGSTFHGRFAQSTQPNNANSLIDLSGVSGVIPVVAGDYFEFGVFQTSGSTISLASTGGPTNVWFQIEVVEGT